MVGKLEKILGGITKKLGQPGANPKYESGTLVGASDYLKEFSEIDTSTTEGQKKYKEMTGSSVKGIFASDVKLTKKQIIDGVREGFDDYVDHHMPSIIEGIGKEMQGRIGYAFCPSEKSKSEPYEAARKVVHTSKEKIEKIESDPEKYIKEEIAKAPDFMKGIVGRFPDEVRKIASMNAQRKALGAIEEYGAGTFVGETYASQLSAEKVMNDREAELEKERADLLKNMNLSLDAEGEANYFAPIAKKEIALKEERSKLVSPKELRETILETALATIKAKEKPAE